MIERQSSQKAVAMCSKKSPLFKFQNNTNKTPDGKSTLAL